MIRLPRFPQVLASLPDGSKIHVVGRDAETLIRLVEKGPRGLRAFDFPGGPPFRLGAYIFDLRGMGLVIRTERARHATGQHGVYFLETPVTIQRIVEGAANDNK